MAIIMNKQNDTAAPRQATRLTELDTECAERTPPLLREREVRSAKVLADLRLDLGLARDELQAMHRH